MRIPLIISLTVVSHFGAAFMHQYSISKTENETQIMISGRIIDGLSLDLKKTIEEHPLVRQVILSSLGGSVSEARRVATVLNDNKLEAIVVDRCASACVYLWAASNRRTLDKHALIGLHRATPRKKASTFLEKPLNEIRRMLADQILRQAGFSQNLIDRGWQTPPGSMLWLTPQQLADNGVVFRTKGSE